MTRYEPLMVDRRTISYALLGVSYCLKQTKRPEWKHTYEADRAALQALLEAWEQ